MTHDPEYAIVGAPRVELLVSPTGVAPKRATDGSSGFDLSCDEPDKLLRPGRVLLFDTGVRIRICTPGWEAQVRPRSGLAAKHGVTVLNAPGTIDADYVGPIKVLLVNLGDETVTIARGQRIAQLVFAPIGVPRFSAWTAEPTVRGEGGFGSTGV